MLVLGIDTSCDDTSAAVISTERDITVLSDVVSSQAEIHKKYGGIVPEIASRRHIENIMPVVEEALRIAGVSLEDLSLLSVCHGPGLIGSLIVGVCFAKSLSFVKGIPLTGVNHLEGHLFSTMPVDPPEFPFLGLIVSGGHTSLVRVDGPLKYKELGKTRDDAAGEAYDKIAKLLGLGYPGGPVIDRLAQKGRADAISFPRPYLHEDMDFSFSGLKTAVLNYVKNLTPEKIEQIIPDLCASFQAAVMDVLEKKVEWALKREGLKTVVVSGGVAANSELRKRFSILGERLGVSVHIPPLRYCTDNAVMIAVAGYYHYRSGKLSDLSLNPRAYVPIEEENL
ncbi:MAG: tRNA (adenosine(37)-N6)-threonylcarbamoyltransferase complex transferase subunit TsaD [Thermodesulfovibrionales bacterium]|nr:tRNA (adenosine(37)-N6)-threonylcarbamoyltransferase complex transferase subunit TsaD [Thermodesulfovibrionales bacterium]